MMLDGKASDDIARAESFQALGAYAGYFTVNEDPCKGESYDATMYIATKGRGIMTRRHDPHKYQTYLFCSSRSSERLKLPKRVIPPKKNWQSKRFFRTLGGGQRRS
jgi:hypothetical protein